MIHIQYRPPDKQAKVFSNSVSIFCRDIRIFKKLRGVHHIPRSQAPRVRITLRSQTAHCGVKIEIFVSLWLPLKGQTGEIL